LRVICLADSQKMLFNSTGIALTNWRELLETRGKQSELTRFINEMICLKTPRSVFVDCTASEATVKFYPAVLAAGIPIVTPNKKANSGKFADYSQLKNLAATTGTRFLYETNVGAGLPIISTLNDLISSGDRIIKIEAVLSGTLSYIFNVFSATEKTFSAIVKEAKSRGYTEPDPRDDLSGLDVARKLLILGRVMGIALELEDVNVENLLSESCYQAPSVDAFLIELQKMDAIFETKKQTARPIGQPGCGGLFRVTSR